MTTDRSINGRKSVEGGKQLRGVDVQVLGLISNSRDEQ